MQIKPDEKIYAARFLNFILSGEQLAFRCAAQQAQLTDDRFMKRFLSGQAKQEKLHAYTFQSAILWLAPRGVQCPASEHMQAYENLINTHLKQKDLYSTVLGLQVILEGVGDVVLNHFNHGLTQRKYSYKKIRKTFLAQECAHHNFGLSYLDNHKILHLATVHQTTSLDHLLLIEKIFTTLHGLFDYFDEDANSYINEFQSNVPEWIHQHALSHYSCSQ